MGNDLAGKVYGCLEAEVEVVTSLEEMEEEMYDLALICDR